MEEIYQITAALKHLSLRQARRRADRRPLLRRLHRRLHRPRRPRGPRRRPDRQGPRRRPDPDRRRPRSISKARVDLVGDRWQPNSAPRRARGVLAARRPHPDLSPDPDLPDDTRLWAALQNVGGGTWGGCVYDPDAIIAASRGSIGSVGEAERNPPGCKACQRVGCVMSSRTHQSARLRVFEVTVPRFPAPPWITPGSGLSPGPTTPPSSRKTT